MQKTQHQLIVAKVATIVIIVAGTIILCVL